MSNNEKTWAAQHPAFRPDRAGKGYRPHGLRPDCGGTRGAAAFTGQFAKEQIHAAGQDLVSRILLGESFTPQQQTPEKELAQTDKEPDQGLDR